MLKNLMGSPTAWAILSAIAVFSALFAIYTWIAGKKRKQLSVVCKTNEIIVSGKSKIDKLFIQYDGADINDLSVTRLFIWNSGNEVINKADIVTSRPISVVNTGKATLLNVQIVKVSEETNAFSVVNQSSERAELDFDYIDQNEGVLIQVLHTGPAIDVEVDYKIKGGKDIRDLSTIHRKRKWHKADWVYSYFFGVVPVISMALFFFISIMLSSLISQIEAIPKAIGVFITLILMLGGLLLGVFAGIKAQKAINRQFHRSIPDTLDR